MRNYIAMDGSECRRADFGLSMCPINEAAGVENMLSPWLWSTAKMNVHGQIDGLIEFEWSRWRNVQTQRSQEQPWLPYSPSATI